MTAQTRVTGQSINDTTPLVVLGILVLLSFVLLPSQFVAALLVTAGFALVGWALRGVSISGALAGWAVAFVIYLGGGRRLFLLLFAVFVLTLVATFGGRSRKKSLGVAEDSQGRHASQVLANLGVATVCVLLAGVFGPVLLVCAIAALAEAAADTVSSEIGQAFGTHTVLITGFTPVSPGTNGGVTWLGSMAGALAAGTIAAIGLLTHMLVARGAAAVAIAAIVGMFVDSLAGARLENRGLNNEAVNLIGTASAALVAVLIFSAR